MPAFIRRLIHRFLAGPDWFWRLVASVPVLRMWINRLFINVVAYSTPARPHPLSLWSPGPASSPPADYPSWTGLTDRRYTGRHLPPAPDEWLNQLPKLADLEPLFHREHFVPCPRSTALFSFFAQWFTDSFLRTDPDDLRKTTSNHEIDLCQIYGLFASDTSLLRSKVGGRLKSQTINGIEYPAMLFNEDGTRVKDEFLMLSYINPDTGDFRYPLNPDPGPARKSRFFAAGLERGNSTIFYSALNSVFLCEHNRLCRVIQAAEPRWDDDRLFEAARCTNTAMLLKIIIEDYINHLSTTAFKLFVEVGFAQKQRWYRTNRIAAEFNLLYRWHSLVPNDCFVDGHKLPPEEFRFNNDALLHFGLPSVLVSASLQRAGKITLGNTPAFLLPAEQASLSKSRAWKLQSFNSYRERFSLPRLKSFEELTDDPALAAALKQVYRSIDNVELVTGLMAEERAADAIFGDLMAFMVGSDAFSQALTNPLLADEVYGPRTFSAAGLAELESTRTLNDVVQRNANMTGQVVSFGHRK